jgi:cell wall-associated NlpC family hydrolase
MMERYFPDSGPELERGDLVFWKGHVGIMLDEERLLHANAFHMMVAIEPLADAATRIEKTVGPVTSIKRPR